MCGIVGIIDPALSTTEIWPILGQMNDVITHRGPDDDGFFVIDGIGLGMRRLSIIDLAGGKQPIYNEDGSIVIVFNGEIYNYRELTRQLQRRGHTFTTASDTEVIVHLYEELGEDCVHHLRGMFAFAVWDKRRRQLFIARDRLGIKPLYYTQVGKRLVFGSEIKSILQHPEVQARLNLEALGNFLSLKYVPAPQTMFTDILSLPPGHTLTCDSNGVMVRQYWDLSFTNNQNGHQREEVYAEQLEALLRESVKLRLRSDVPFGAFLSGGIDSSTVVALMSQFLDEPVKTFSVGFDTDGAEADELPYARLVAQQYQTDHHEILITSQDFIDLAEKVAWHLDQPIADQATVATYMVSKLASQHVKMVLTGEGGDELFAGYARYAGERLSPMFRYIPRPIRSLALAASERLPGLRRAKIALYALCQPDETSRFTNWFPLFNYDRKRAVLSGNLKLDDMATNHVFAQQLARTNAIEPLNRMLYVDTKLWLPDYLLLRGDKLSMANSLEARVPILDHKLVEFAASLPPNLKLRHLTRKYLLKKSSRTLLPAEIIDRKKQGFPIPITRWLRNEARPFVRDLLSPAAIKRRGLFDLDYVEKMLGEYESGFADHSNLLWGLVSIELWHRCFIDSSHLSKEVADPVIRVEQEKQRERENYENDKSAPGVDAAGE
ncbi:MAG: asparagine synthase (glutamine-hydrolyzing) [Anaerolineales bacterium]|nr:MAG: asparagine synthase (glutamine-hydrolyzing) [Anaerolineales bacterium]